MIGISIGFLPVCLAPVCEGLGCSLERPCFAEVTARSRRDFPMGDAALEVLAVHLQSFPAEPGQLIFRRANGMPWWRPRAGETMRRAANEAGIAPGWHQLRHHFASLAIESGISVVRLSAWMGHATTSGMLDT